MPGIGWESLPLLASYRFSGSSATSSVLTIPACEMLQIQFNIEGYNSSAIAALRFNGDSATANYTSSYTTFSTAAPGTPVQNTSALNPFGGFKLGGNAVTAQRSGLVTIKNNPSTSHGITCQSQTHAAASAAPVSSWGSGVYVTGGAAQITSIQLINDAATPMPAGTSFAIFGMNP